MNPKRPVSPDSATDPVDRRQFLKTAAAGAAAFAGVTRSIPLALASACLPPPVRHLIPADKGLSPEWRIALRERGGTRVCRGDELGHIGMPVGGIAAGQLYLRGDGTLSCWQIFNGNYFSGWGATNYQQPLTPSPVKQGFYICGYRAGETQVHANTLSSDGFENVESVGEYPVATVRYSSSGSPFAATLRAFSPFIPLSAADSALPCTVFEITIENPNDGDIHVAIVPWLENAVCFHNAKDNDALRRTRTFIDGGRIVMLHTAEESPAATRSAPRAPIVLADFEQNGYGEWVAAGRAMGGGPAPGTWPGQQPVTGFVGEGLVNTYLRGDDSEGSLLSPAFEISRDYLNFLIGGGAHAGRTCINLLVDGKVVRSATGRNEERLVWHSWDVRDLAGKAARIEIVDRQKGPWGHVNVDQIELADERRSGAGGALDQLYDYGSMALVMGAEDWLQSDEDLLPVGLLPPKRLIKDETYPVSKSEQAAFRTAWFVLKPGKSRTLRLVLAWHFPNSPNGHQYATRFADAAGVAAYVLDNYDRLAGDTRLWHDTFYDSTLPRWLLDRIGSTLCNLATGTTQWWKNRRFWAWEGVGCCHGTCTHVWNYAHAMARLFPELERSVREMQDLGAAFHPSGLIGFRGEQNGAYAADGQCGTVLKCYREHLMSADEGFLRRHWQKIKKAIQFAIAQDRDEDGLIENSQHNTYDINFEGPNTFVGSLYLAALRAGEEMAREMDDKPFAARLRGIFERGRERSIKELWNGEYFIQKVDLDVYPRDQYGDGCLSDQLFGQGWAHQLGLGYIYPAEYVKKALGAIWKYNWAPDVGPHNAAHKPERWFVSPGEAGLFTCTWPKSQHLDEGVRYRDEVWTGIEYQVAGHMIWEGMIDEALSIVRAIHERYDAKNRNPYNEVECGDHYARALASWGVLTALAGFEYHGPRGYLAFAPRITPENFRCPFTSAEGWGTISQSRSATLQTNSIETRWGRLRLRRLDAQTTARVARVEAGIQGRSIPLQFSQTGNDVTIEFSEGLSLDQGAILAVRLHAG